MGRMHDKSKERLTVRSAAFLGGGEPVVAVAAVVRPGYNWFYVMWGVTTAAVFIGDTVLESVVPFGWIGGLVASMIALFVLMFAVHALLARRDRARCDVVAARGVPISSSMVLGLTPHWLLLWRGMLWLGSPQELLLAVPRSELERFEPRRGGWPGTTVDVRLSGVEFAVEIGSITQLDRFLAELATPAAAPVGQPVP